MKRVLLTILSVIVLSIGAMAQSPSKFNYQAVARDASGTPLASQAVGVRISVLEGSTTGTAVYSEEHTPTTNAFGLFNFQIGDGTNASGSLSTIDWASDAHFIKVEIDDQGGTNFAEVSTSELVSVPYALLANDVVNDAVDDADADPANELQFLSQSGDTISISNGNSIVFQAPMPELNDNDSTNELQTLTLSGTDLALSNNGGTADLSSLDQSADIADIHTEMDADSAMLHGLISDNASDIATNATDISDNATDIATNATGISDNATDIAANTSDIADNATDIATNASDISDNATDIATNASDISDNATDIATNATDIATNATDIATNASDISDNATDIATNASNISDNATDIATNATAIAAHNTADGDLDDENEIQTLSYNNTTNTLTLSDGGGSVVVPQRVAFHAARTASGTIGNGTVIVCNQEIVDNAGAYNPSNGVFYSTNRWSLSVYL